MKHNEFSHLSLSAPHQFSPEIGFAKKNCMDPKKIVLKGPRNCHVISLPKANSSKFAPAN